jgi:succinate dehydrogenase / fumarate reductase cytochrome b subunit
VSLSEVARKVFALTGVLPLGAFLLEHLVVASAALRGERAFTDASLAIQRLPLVRVLEVLIIWAPLAVHTAYGLYVIALRKQHGPAYLYSTRVRVLMRITAIVSLAFIAYHAIAMRGAASGASVYTVVASRLSWTAAGIPFVALFYLLGVTSTVFHFSAGLWGAMVTWRWLPSERAKMIARVACAALGLALGVAGTLPVVTFATGTSLFGGGDVEELELAPKDTPCPAASAP